MQIFRVKIDVEKIQTYTLSYACILSSTYRRRCTECFKVRYPLRCKYLKNFIVETNETENDNLGAK